MEKLAFLFLDSRRMSISMDRNGWGDDRKHVKSKTDLQPHFFHTCVGIFPLVKNPKPHFKWEAYISVIYSTDGGLGGPMSLLKHTHKKTSKAI